MEATKTETLADVLRDIINYPVTRFWPDMDGDFIVASANNYTTGIHVDSINGHDEMLIQAACQEECDARSWEWHLESDPDDGTYEAEILEWRSNDDGTRRVFFISDTMEDPPKSPALAIATALRDALKTEQP